MGLWVAAKRNGRCYQCERPFDKDEQIYLRPRGVVLCELCGSAAEHEDRQSIGEVEQGVLNDLGKLPSEASETVIAAALLDLARDIDSGFVQPRDKASYNKELRQHLAALRDLYPPKGEADGTDKVQERWETSLGGQFEEPYSP